MPKRFPFAENGAGDIVDSVDKVFTLKLISPSAVYRKPLRETLQTKNILTTIKIVMPSWGGEFPFPTAVESENGRKNIVLQLGFYVETKAATNASYIMRKERHRTTCGVFGGVGASC